MNFLRFSLFLALLSLVHSYEFYTFTQEIPGTICKYKNCLNTEMGNEGQNTMNLHGLWPDTADPSKRPFNCQANLYDEDKLDNALKSNMDKSWVGLYNSTFWFRFHEWGKHGTCWEDTSLLKKEKGFLTEEEDYFVKMNHFFQKVMDVKKKVNLESLIYSDGVPERTFHFQDLNAAILNHIGVEKYYIHCETLNGVQYLDCIRVCLDLNYNYIDCPETTAHCKTDEDVVVPQLNKN